MSADGTPRPRSVTPAVQATPRKSAFKRQPGAHQSTPLRIGAAAAHEVPKPGFLGLLSYKPAAQSGATTSLTSNGRASTPVTSGTRDQQQSSRGATAPPGKTTSAPRDRPHFPSAPPASAKRAAADGAESGDEADTENPSQPRPSTPKRARANSPKSTNASDYSYLASKIDILEQASKSQAGIITQLREKVQKQEKTIGEQADVIYGIWHENDTLQEEKEQLEGRVKALEEGRDVSVQTPGAQAVGAVGGGKDNPLNLIMRATLRSLMGIEMNAKLPHPLGEPKSKDFWLVVSPTEKHLRPDWREGARFNYPWYKDFIEKLKESGLSLEVVKPLNLPDDYISKRTNEFLRKKISETLYKNMRKKYTKENLPRDAQAEMDERNAVDARKRTRAEHLEKIRERLEDEYQDPEYDVLMRHDVQSSEEEMSSDEDLDEDLDEDGNEIPKKKKGKKDSVKTYVRYSRDWRSPECQEKMDELVEAINEYLTELNTEKLKLKRPGKLHSLHVAGGEVREAEHLPRVGFLIPRRWVDAAWLEAHPDEKKNVTPLEVNNNEQPAEPAEGA